MKIQVGEKFQVDLPAPVSNAQVLASVCAAVEAIRQRKAPTTPAAESSTEKKKAGRAKRGARFKQLSLLLLLLLVARTQPANAGMLNVYVNCTGDDPVGMRLCTHVKDLFAQSPRFHLIGRAMPHAVEVDLISVPVDADATASAISQAILMDGASNVLPSFIIGVVYVCGRNNVSGIADSIVAQTDNATQPMRPQGEIGQ